MPSASTQEEAESEEDNTCKEMQCTVAPEKLGENGSTLLESVNKMLLSFLTNE